MSWREDTRQASFKGIPFHVRSSDLEGGRRVVTHEFPGRDASAHEDLGIAPKQITLTAYFIGDDYLQRRDRLLAVLDGDPTAGTLITPTHGQLRVVAKPYRAGWQDRELGYEAVELTFVQVGDLTTPTPTRDETAIVAQAAEAHEVALVSDFEGTLKQQGLPSWVQQASQLQHHGLLQRLKNSFAFGGFSATGLLTLNGLVTRLDTLVGLDGLGLQLLATYQQIKGVLPQGVDAPRYWFSVHNAYPGYTPPYSGATNERQQQANELALKQLYALGALSQVAQAIANKTYTSQASLQADMVQWRGAVDRHLSFAGNGLSDVVYRGLKDLDTQLTTWSLVELKGLPAMRLVTLNSPTPALVLAYNLYEDALRDIELVNENKVSNPNSLPAGVALRVLAE